MLQNRRDFAAIVKYFCGLSPASTPPGCRTTSRHARLLAHGCMSKFQKRCRSAHLSVPRQDSPSFFPRSPERGDENSQGQRPWNVRPSSSKLCRSERSRPAQPAVRAPRQGLTTAGPSFSRGVAPGYFRSSLQDAQERLFPQSLAPWRLWVGAQGAKDFSPRTRATAGAIRPLCRHTILYGRYRRPQRPRCGSHWRLL